MLSRIGWMKIAAALILLYLLYLTITCPCPRLWCCHLGFFYVMIAALLGLSFLENGFKITDPTCG